MCFLTQEYRNDIYHLQAARKAAWYIVTFSNIKKASAYKFLAALALIELKINGVTMYQCGFQCGLQGVLTAPHT